MGFLVDPTVKKGCCSLTFQGDGVTTLFKHPPNILFSDPRTTSPNDLIKLVENTNATTTNAGVIAAILDDPPKTYPDCSFIAHQVALMQGITIKNQFVYHKWKYSGSLDDLHALILSNCSNKQLNSILFEDEPTLADIKTNYVMYFSQLKGPKHWSWQSDFQVTRHPSGHDIFQSSLFQDNWGDGLYLPKSVEIKPKFYRFNTNVVHAWCTCPEEQTSEGQHCWAFYNVTTI